MTGPAEFPQIIDEAHRALPAGGCDLTALLPNATIGAGGDPVMRNQLLGRMLRRDGIEAAGVEVMDFATPVGRGFLLATRLDLDTSIDERREQ